MKWYKRISIFNCSVYGCVCVKMNWINIYFHNFHRRRSRHRHQYHCIRCCQECERLWYYTYSTNLVSIFFLLLFIINIIFIRLAIQANFIELLNSHFVFTHISFFFEFCNSWYAKCMEFKRKILFFFLRSYCLLNVSVCQLRTSCQMSSFLTLSLGFSLCFCLCSPCMYFKYPKALWCYLLRRRRQQHGTAPCRGLRHDDDDGVQCV